MKRIWRIHEPDPSVVDSLSEHLKIRRLYCELLVNRGISGYKEAKDFFLPTLDQLHDPFLMDGMEQAVILLNQTLDSNKKILIYGDYDVDGTTATTLIYKALNSFSSTHSFAIPHREKDGYGLSKSGIDNALKEQCSLLITVDCGIRDIDAIAYAKERGLQVIVVDHHEPGSTLPPADAILNPKQDSCRYPYKYLSGCGIAFKLTMAMYHSRKLPEASCYEFLDLVALSIAADMVPLTGENRILAYYGLKRINENPNKNLEQLLGWPIKNKPVSLTDVAFQIAPKINAAGRMDSAEKAVHMLLSESLEQALELANQLMLDNDDRKRIELQISEEAIAQIESNPEAVTQNSIVVFNSGWHKGVLGIVAARLCERYHKPAIVLTGSNDTLSGSVRSIPGLNVYQALLECQSLMVRFGGHEAAAGITLKKGLFAPFKEAFEMAVSKHMHIEISQPELWIDAKLDLTEISTNLFNTITRFEPFGIGNPQPIFLATEVRNLGEARVLKDKHLKLQLNNDPFPPLDAIGFGLADKFDAVQSGNPFDICYCLEGNYWNGDRKLQLRILDLEPSKARHV